jgi:hypothetical protein
VTFVLSRVTTRRCEDCAVKEEVGITVTTHAVFSEK